MQRYLTGIETVSTLAQAVTQPHWLPLLCIAGAVVVFGGFALIETRRQQRLADEERWYRTLAELVLHDEAEEMAGYSNWED